MHNPLTTKLCGVTFKNPVIAASGTFGFGEEYAPYLDVSSLGGISCKGLTLQPSSGNCGVRIFETPSGLLNSIGLENPGVRAFINEKCALMRSFGVAVIANLGGHSMDDYIAGAALLDESDIDIIELNISCPNVKEGGMSFGVDPDVAKALVKELKPVVKQKPLLVKLSPNAGDILAVAKACEDAGADGLSLVNTFLGMAIDIKNRRPVFDNTYAGLSGPAIMPIALRMVHQVAKAVTIPIVGMGGIMSANDALAFMMAGATAVQVGTATFVNPLAMLDIIDGISNYVQSNDLKNIGDIVGIV